MAQNEAKVKVSADNSKLKRGLNDSKKQLSGFQKTVKGVQGALGSFAGPLAIGAVVTGLVNMMKKTGEAADRLLDLEQITGISTDTLQEYEHVARVAGVNSETMANAVQGLTRRLARGAEMSAGLRMGLEALGIEAFDGAGNLRDLGKVTEEAIEQLAGMEDISKRNVIGAQLFSGAWKDLAPVLALGADGIEKAKQEARELGLVMSKDALESANEFRIEMETLTAQFEMSKRELSVGLMPVLQTLMGLYSDTITSVKGLGSAFREMVGPQVLEGLIKLGKGIVFYNTWHVRLLKTAGDYSKTRQETSKTEAEIAEEIWNQKAAADAAKDAAEAAAKDAAEAERIAVEQTESERRAALGELGRLQEDLKTAEQNYIAANTTAEQQRWAMRKLQLQQEIDLINQRNSAEGLGGAEADRRGLTGITPMTPMGAPMLDDGLETFKQQQQERVIALKQVSDQAQATGESFIDMQQSALDSAFAVGQAFGDMASDSGKSTQEIIAQMIKQITASLIQQMIATIPFPANLAAAAGAGVLASSLFSQIPGFANGTDYAPGGMAWVGERGPELVNLPRGSQVFSNQESMGMGGGEVRFIIDGDKLAGVLRRYSNRLSRNT